MADVFLPGPFAADDILRAVLGGDPGDASPVAATLAGYALRVDPNGAKLELVPRAGATAPGGVARVEPDAAARIAFAMAAFGSPRAARLRTEQGQAIEAFLAASPGAPAEDWPAAPDAEWRAHLAEAAEEVMAHFGRRNAQEMPALLQGISHRALARVRGRADGRPTRQPGGAAADVEAVALERPYARHFAIEEHRVRHRRFDGGMSGPIDRAVFASGDAVTVLPFDPLRRAVLLIEQFRIGPHARRDRHPWQIEAVAGRCDVGEGPGATARREAREEAGIELGRIERIAGYYTSPGVMAEHITAYVGEADLGGAGGVHGLAAEDEDIRVLVVPLGEALELVATGEVNNGPLLISLLWLGGQAERLTAEWGSPHAL